jgi:hypothetical protein
MENLINRLTLNTTPASSVLKRVGGEIMAFFDRLEATIGIVQAHNSRTKLQPADMRTLGLPDQ